MTTTFNQIETSPLTRRQKVLIGAAIVGNMLEFFDLFLVGFVLSIISEPWGLTFGQSTFVLLTSGAGAILGAFLFGHLADRIGRRVCFIATVLLFSLATGAMALLPDGAWFALGSLRFFVGLGVGGLIAVDLPLIQEFVPTRRRGFLSGLIVVLVPAGLLLGSVAASTVGATIGWRGLVLLGLLPALLSLFVRAVVPESPRWLIRQGRHGEARKSVAWALHIPESSVVLPDQLEEYVHTPWREIFAYRRSIALTWIGSFGVQTAYYGVVLWAPTLIALTLGVSPARAAFLYIFVALAGIGARFVWALLGDRFGRLPVSTFLAAASAAMLLTIAFTHDASIAGVQAFYPMLIVMFIFVDGVFSVLMPYHAEVFPTHLRSSGYGSSYGFGGIGKILGPAMLALISGVGTLVTPQATVSAIPGAFILLAGGSVVLLCANLVFGISTKGVSLEELDALLETQRRPLPRRAQTQPLSATDQPTRKR